MSTQDYMRPVRDAARSLSDQIAAGEVDAGDIHNALIEFAGSILDAVRVEAAEAMRLRNLDAIKAELNR